METILARAHLTPHTELLLEVADLTQLKVDAIVNARQQFIETWRRHCRHHRKKKAGPIITQES